LPDGRRVKSVAFSPDGKLVASGSFDGTVQLWDVATGAPRGEPPKGHSGWVSSVAFSPDGKLVVSGLDNVTVRLWDAATGAPRGDVVILLLRFRRRQLPRVSSVNPYLL
jgi:WD40 repeat protein